MFTRADAELLRVASTDPSRESRKDALFWMGQLRGETGAAAIAPFLTDDLDAEVREHAGFAISQSRSARRAELLIKQAQHDSNSQVCSQAWFWLAQTGDAQAGRAIGAAVQNDPPNRCANKRSLRCHNYPSSALQTRSNQISPLRILPTNHANQTPLHPAGCGP